MRIHPRLAGAIFIFLYNLIGGLVYFISISIKVKYLFV